MTVEYDHAACVDAWWTRHAREGQPHASLRALERGFRLVWTRAHVTLGAVTLTAIGERVLHDVAEDYPPLAALRIDAEGISCEDLEQDVAALEPADLDRALRRVLVELLVVLGRLTGEVLTPVLHAELSRSPRDVDEESAP